MASFPPPSPLAESFADRKSQIQQLALSGSLNLWDQIVNGPDDDTADDFAAAWAPVRTGNNEQVAALTDAYVDAFLESHGLDPDSPGIDPEEVAELVRPGVSSEEIARRPVKEVRYALSEDASLTEALDRGRRRLESIHATDIQQSFRVALHERLADEPKLQSYRRVLQGPENCAMCVVASTQRYHTGRLNPIHPGCDCSVELLPPGPPSGPNIDSDRLEQVKGILSEEGVSYGDRAQLANTKIRLNITDVDDVTEVPHGELGPILAVQQHRNTDFSDLPDWVRRSRREFAPGGRQTRGAGTRRLGVPPGPLT